MQSSSPTSLEVVHKTAALPLRTSLIVNNGTAARFQLTAALAESYQAAKEPNMGRYLTVSYSMLWLLVFSAPGVQGAERGRDQLHTIRIAYVSPVTTMAPIWIASEIGAYQREARRENCLH